MSRDPSLTSALIPFISYSTIKKTRDHLSLPRFHGFHLFYSLVFKGLVIVIPLFTRNDAGREVDRAIVATILVIQVEASFG